MFRLIGNSLVRSLGDSSGRWEVECYPGATLERMREAVVDALVLGEVVVLLVGVPDLQGGRGGIWLRRELRLLMEEYAGLVPCTFWPPVGAEEDLVAEVVRTNELIRNQNVNRDWGNLHLEAGIFNRTNGKYRVNGRTLRDGLHPTEQERSWVRERLEEWCELMKRRGKLSEGGRTEGVPREEDRFRSGAIEEGDLPEERPEELVVTVVREEEEFEEGELEGQEEEELVEQEGEEETVEGLREETVRKRMEMEARVRKVDQEIRQLEEKKRRINAGVVKRERTAGRGDWKEGCRKE